MAAARVQRRLGLALVLVLLMAAWLPTGAARTETADYVAAHGNGILYSCSAETHPLVPQGPPDPSQPVQWLFSGRPHCAPVEVLNTLRGDQRAFGLGGYAFPLEWSDRNQLVHVDVQDQTGDGFLSLFAASTQGAHAATEGCGAQQITIPSFPAISPGGGTVLPLWAMIHAVGVEEDGSFCLGSAGTLRATFPGS